MSRPRWLSPAGTEETDIQTDGRGTTPTEGAAGHRPLPMQCPGPGSRGGSQLPGGPQLPRQVFSGAQQPRPQSRDPAATCSTGPRTQPHSHQRPGPRATLAPLGTAQPAPVQTATAQHRSSPARQAARRPPLPAPQPPGAPPCTPAALGKPAGSPPCCWPLPSSGRQWDGPSCLPASGLSHGANGHADTRSRHTLLRSHTETRQGHARSCPHPQPCLPGPPDPDP